MKIAKILLLLFLSFKVQSQHTVSGNFSPADAFRYIMVYHLSSDGIQYVTDTGVKDGQFSFTLPNSVSPGTYRLVYGVPQDEYFIDIVYNCEEDIVFNFNLDEGITIVSSKENMIYYDYFTEIENAKDALMAFYSEDKSDKKEYMDLVNNLKQVQYSFETQSQGLIADTFVKANRHYLPKEYMSLEDYLIEKKKHYFDAIDFKNATLQPSEFFSDKIINYMFWAIPPGTPEKDLVKEINKNVDFLASKLEVVPKVLQTSIWAKAWNKANESEVYTVSDYIFNTYLKKLATDTNNANLITNIETQTRLRKGAVSPDITWEENGVNKSLSGLTGASNYLLIFWSSTCSHCLNELPGLHEHLKTVKDLKVLAVGLEDGKENWEQTIPKLPDFHHAIALEKWESPYVKTFAIQQTPTYFILDKDKRFLDRPESAEAVVDYLKRSN
ncbi:thioredoxin-like domain-containing protein [Maribacter aurantiacus]|uniref:Redoxin domain-containing protein n=1 Tax=Maribacter aurantiacus TaxID=1882343 RepID=A0A5R8M6Z3_9FLAO|nr:thioredoxin-like domain-containing protein [Maribacter aurantiacus]TLF45334.1 redoxin domain-containing protein [Maribacter aurantiacus]